jgi:hypothetical protein
MKISRKCGMGVRKAILEGDTTRTAEEGVVTSSMAMNASD